MAYFMKNIVIPTSLSCFFLLFSHSTWSETNISQTKQRIIEQRNYWLDEIKNGVITTSPQKGSRTAELDRIISNNYQDNDLLYQVLDKVGHVKKVLLR